jgi:hypothetical protein
VVLRGEEGNEGAAGSLEAVPQVGVGLSHTAPNARPSRSQQGREVGFAGSWSDLPEVIHAEFRLPSFRLGDELGPTMAIPAKESVSLAFRH